MKNEWTASYYPNKIPLPNGKCSSDPEHVILWWMNKELEKQGIKNWENDPNMYSNTDEGWLNPSKLCSEILLEDKTGLYLSAAFYSVPELSISKILIDDYEPTDCQKWFWIPYEIKFENGKIVYTYEHLPKIDVGNLKYDHSLN